MKTATPRQTAIFIAIFTALVAGLAMLLIYSIREFNFILAVVFALLIIFIVTYTFVSYVLGKIILKRINPILKTIYETDIPEDIVEKELEEDDIISTAGKDVLTWAKRKTKEIVQLRQMEKYRQEFLGNVYHELKTPLFNIQGYVSTLLEGGLEDSEVNMQYLENTDKNINRLISIVTDLETISELESGVQKLNLKKLNIVALFEESFELHRLMAKEKGIKLKFAGKREKPINVIGDKKRISEVINNLINNSIKYGNENGSTKVDFTDMDDKIIVEVSDNGIGIPRNDLPRIFERFYRIDKSHSRQMGGTGLGLSIVKHIIEAHNQKISVRSKPGEGTSFSFTLNKT